MMDRCRVHSPGTAYTLQASLQVTVVGIAAMASGVLADAAGYTSVFALGAASSLAGAAQSAFALNLDAVAKTGIGKAMGVQRAADKLGQMPGPLLVGPLFASVGAASGLAITGALYLAATLLFLAVAHSPGNEGAV